MLSSRRIPRVLQWLITVGLLWMVLMTLYRFYFFFHYRPANRPFSGSAFLLGLRFDARVVCSVLLATGLLSFIPWLNPMRNRKAVLGWTILYTFLFFLILLVYGADFYHYDYLKQRLNAAALNLLEDTAISFRMMWQTYPLLKIGLALLLLCWLFERWYHRLLKRLTTQDPAPLRKPFRIGYYAAFVLLAALGIFGKAGQYPLRWSDAFAFQDEFKAHTALNPFQSFFSTLSFRKSGYDLHKVKTAYPLLAEYLGVQQPDSLTLNYTRNYTFTDTFRRPPNVVLVICESFSAYMSSMYGNPMNSTPYFNGLCEQGIFFDRCFTPAFGTARGVWAVITGIPDVEQPKTASRNPLAVDQHSIIADFDGYDKFYFLGGSTTWANIRGLLHNNIPGLKIYEQDDFKAGQVDVWGISDKNLFLEANGILKNQVRPFFAIIQTADNHRPYTIPAEDIGPFQKKTYPADSLKKYGFENNDQLNAFRYTDFTFQTFIEQARKESYFPNTIFVFVGDHGLRGRPGNLFPESFNKQGIHAEHVPLLFYAPGILQPKRIDAVASQLDILPSLAGLCRQSYRNQALGRNLFDTVQPRIPVAFIADPDRRTVSVVSDDYCYSRGLGDGKISFMSVRNNAPVPSDAQTIALKEYMARLTEAFYETARYLLTHNKK